MALSSVNMSAQEYLELMRGPQQIAPSIVIPITVVYILVFVSGVIGNVIVCLVIARNAQFQTPTNYYLFSLAISDLLILMFGLPNDLKVYWQQYPWVFGETVCKLRALVAEMTSYASVLTIVAFSSERYLAICHPLLIQKVSSLSRAIKVVTGVWIGACVAAIPFAIFTQVNYLTYPNGTGEVLADSAFCALPMDNNDISLPLVQFSSIFFFCLPMILIVVIYIKIGLKVRRSRFSTHLRSQGSQVALGRRSSGNGGGPTCGEGCNVSEMVRAQKPPPRKSIHTMLVAVVIAFFVCWAPFHTQRLLACFFQYGEWTLNLRRLNEILYYTGGCLYYFSATINPILYSLLSVKYREAFRDALCSFGAGRGFVASRRNKDYDHSVNASRASVGRSNDAGLLPEPQKPRGPSTSSEASKRAPTPFQESNSVVPNISDDQCLRVPNGQAIMLASRPEKTGSARKALAAFFRLFHLKKEQRIMEDGRTIPTIRITGSSPELSPDFRKEREERLKDEVVSCHVFKETTV